MRQYVRFVPVVTAVALLGMLSINPSHEVQRAVDSPAVVYQFDQIQQPEGADPEVLQDENVAAEIARLRAFLGIDVAQQLGATGEGVVIHVVDTGSNYDWVSENGACFSTDSSTDSAAVSICQNGLAKDTSPGAGKYCPDSETAGSIDKCGHGNSSTWLTKLVAPAAEFRSYMVGMRRKIGNSIKGSFMDSHLVNALDYIADKINYEPGKKHVVSMSMGSAQFFPDRCNDHARPYEPTIKKLKDVDAYIMFSAGNRIYNTSYSTGAAAPACIGYVPTRSDGINAVAALDGNFSSIADFSGFNADTTFLAAPGTYIPSIRPDGTSIHYSGTSPATPLVAGAAAALASMDPNLTPSQAEQRLIDTSTPITVLFRADAASVPINHTIGAIDVSAAAADIHFDTEPIVDRKYLPLAVNTW